MGLGLRAPHLARQPLSRPYPQAATDRTAREPLIASPTGRSGRAQSRIPSGPRPAGPTARTGGSLLLSRLRVASACQAAVHPSASRSALWIAVAAIAASAPATAIWFRPRTTSPAA